MKLGTVIPYLKEIQKMYESQETHPLSSAGISAFSVEVSKFCYIKKDIISNSFNFLKSLKVLLIKMVMILMMSVKLATLGLLKIKII